MQNFDTFFKQHFRSREISDDELNRYSLEHIQLLSAVPRFATVASLLTAAHTAYFGAITDEGTKAAIMKGLTNAMEMELKGLLAKLSQHEGTIRGKFGKDSASYLRFFPQGLTEYQRATRENIDQKITRFAAALGDFGDQLASEVVDDFTHAGDESSPPRGVIVRFRNALAAQRAAKAAFTASKAPSSATRAALEDVCMRALLTVALDGFTGTKTDAERRELRRLFPQHHLDERATPEPEPEGGTPPPQG